MAKFNVYKLTDKKRNELFNNFYLSIVSLETVEEVKDFFKDLLETHEVAMFSRRLLVAKMLASDITFEQISQGLGMGMDTIAKVQRWLQEGNGYKLVIKRSKKYKNSKTSSQERYNPFSSYNLKKKYSLYYWPEELVKDIDKLLSEYIKKKRKRKSLKNRSNN